MSDASPPSATTIIKRMPASSSSDSSITMSKRRKNRVSVTSVFVWAACCWTAAAWSPEAQPYYTVRQTRGDVPKQTQAQSSSINNNHHHHEYNSRDLTAELSSPPAASPYTASNVPLTGTLFPTLPPPPPQLAVPQHNGPLSLVKNVWQDLDAQSTTVETDCIKAQALGLLSPPLPLGGPLSAAGSSPPLAAATTTPPGRHPASGWP